MRKLASWLLLALAAAAPAQLAQGIEAKLDEVFKPWDKKDAPGGVVSVSVKGKLVYEKAFGMANLESNVPNTVETVFDVGSISKQFTAACVMLLQDDGKLDIDDEASKYLTEFPVLRDNKITVRQLMAHTSGLRDYMSLMVFKSGKFAFEDDEVVEALKGQSTLNFPPGMAWDYSNTGFYFLKKLVEKVSGKSLAEFAKERLFTPLGMGHTQFLDDHSLLIPGRAFGYMNGGEGKGYRAGITMIAADGAGGLWTTLADMHKWTQNWKKNKLGNDPQMFAKMQTKQKLVLGTDTVYGLGFFIDDYKGVARIQHGGDFVGFHAQVNWFPEQDVVVATFSNDGTQNAKGFNDKTVDVVLADVIKPGPGDNKTEITLSEQVLDEYVGRYDISTVIIEFKRDGSKLMAQVTGQPEFEVFATEKDHFFWKVVEARLEFARDEGGNVTGLTLFQGGAEIVCPRSKPFAAPPEMLDALVGYYYSTELDVMVHIKRDGDKLTATSNTILDAFPMTPVNAKRLTAGPLSIDIEWDDKVVKSISVNMPRATKMKFVRMSS
jgi:CubicO group peptidase (beta-lactamase class C family)